MNQHSVADRPAHWVLAEAGKEVLRPGGRELTEAMIDALDVGPEDDVVEFAPGVGATARRVLERNPRSYTGVELDQEAARALEADIGGPNRTVTVGHAGDSGLDPASADVVYGEAMLTMQPDDGKAEIASEANRLLRSGGVYGIHELALQPEDLDDGTKARIHDDLAATLNVNAQPLTHPEWTAILDSAGFDVVWQASAPMGLLDPGRMLEDEGLLGAARIWLNLLTKPPIRRRVRDMRSVFDRHEQHLDAVAMVAKKRED